MGVWGTGLYSGDFAMDLRSTIGAVSKLPFDGDRIVDVVCSTEPGVASNAEDSDHAVFWLVLADQFAKRGIVSERAKETALAILDSNADIEMHEKLGMPAADLRKRRKMLDEVRGRILAPTGMSTPRKVMTRPQPLLMEVGDVLIYPTFGGRCRNPYFVSQEDDRMGTPSLSWRADSWAAMVIVDCGRAFDYLAWYRPLTVCSTLVERPTIEDLQGEVLWKLVRPGTSTSPHFKRMGIEKIGSLEIDSEKLKRTFPEMRPATSAAVSNISIANQLNVIPYLTMRHMQLPGEPPNRRFGGQYPAILGIEQILA